MFHPQTTEIQPFKVKHFSIKTLKFQQYDIIIIYDVIADFEILSGMWNSTVESYPRAKCPHDMTINNRINWIFHVFLFCAILDNRQRSQYNIVINYDVISFMQIFSIFELTPWWSISVQNFIVIGPLATKI